MHRLRLYREEERLADDSIIAVTGIGMISSLGSDRESVWKAIQRGDLGARYHERVGNVPNLGLAVAGCDGLESDRPASDRAVEMALTTARESLQDAGLDLEGIDRERFGVSTSAHFGDTTFLAAPSGFGAVDTHPWWNCWLPNSGCSIIANHFGLGGIKVCYSTACASSLVSIIMAARQLSDRQCDFMLAGGMEAVHPLVAAAFRRMGVLASESDNAATACRPFDKQRSGFVMGEGAAMLVLERASDARARGAKIYGEIVASKFLSEAAHVTSLDETGAPLARLLESLIRSAYWRPEDVTYVNAHGTGTEQNDRNELAALSSVFGDAASQLAVGSIKGMIGHTINAAGSLELATTLLAMRDGFRPPTRNLIDQESPTEIDCLGEYGSLGEVQQAIKMSAAFGGHLAAIAIEKPSHKTTRAAVALDPKARIREARHLFRRRVA